MAEPTLMRWSRAIAEAFRVKALEFDDFGLQCEPWPPATIDTPAVVLYPGGPGSFDEGPDGEAVTFCLRQMAWSAWLFFGPPGDADWRAYFWWAEVLPDVMALVPSIDLADDGPGLPLAPRIDRISSPSLTEWGGASFWSASVDLSVPIELEATP